MPGFDYAAYSSSHGELPSILNADDSLGSMCLDVDPIHSMDGYAEANPLPAADSSDLQVVKKNLMAVRFVFRVMSAADDGF